MTTHATTERPHSPADAALDAFGALLVTPDFVQQGLEGALLAHLERLEVTVVAAVPYVFGAHDTSALYEPSLARRDRPRRPSSWLSLELFGLGHCVLLLLRGSPSQPSVQARLTAHKGPSSYVQRDHESLRGMSPIADRYFSLVHSPDDNDELRRLCALVLGERAAGRALAGELPPVPEEALRQLLGAAPLRQESHPFDVLLRSLGLGVAVLAADPRLPPSARPLKALASVRAARRSLRYVERGEPLARAAMAALTGLAPAMAQVRERLREVGAGDDWRELGWAHARIELGAQLAALCDPAQLDPTLIDAYVALLRRNHLVLDDFTQHRLRVLSALYGSAAQGGAGATP